jgi:tight adherence protein B
MDSNQIIALTLVAIVIGAIGYTLLPYLTGSVRGERRQAALLQGNLRVKNAASDRSQELAQRRKQIAESIKDLDKKTTKRKLTLEARMLQAGLTWTKPKFFMISAMVGVFVGFLLLMISGNLLYALAGMVIGGFGFPNWFVNFMRKRRINKFVQEFPNAVDVIIRGIKAGLPLGDCLRIIAAEAAEPVRSEFRRVVEAQTMGLTIAESVERLTESIPTPEANFFAIVINIQQKAGGNLSEALGNLARVLRDRKKMQLKIKAMSAEAKASAGIIGALPFVVSGMVYLTSPRYMELLWLTPSGRVVMVVCGFWMFIGVMSMRKMIAFDI